MNIITSRRATALGLVLLVAVFAAAGWMVIRRNPPSGDFRLTVLPQGSSSPDGWIWLLKLFNKKQVLQTEAKAIEQVQKVVKGH